MKKRILAIGFIFLILVSILPTRIMALSSGDSVPPVPVGDAPLRSKEAGITVFGYTIPGLTWDLIGITIAKIALEQILQATTDWINSGFEGNPAYATDPAQFFTNIADGIAGDFIAGSDLAFLCSPFQIRVRLALQQYHTQRRQFQCTLTQVVGNIDAFYNDFSKGGWKGWFSMTQNNTNNPYGAYLEAQIELDSRIASAIGIQDKQLSWNSGFISWAECTRKAPGTGECLERGPVKTPGKVIESQLENVLGTGVKQLELADEFDELVSALFVQLLKQVVFGVKGLFSEDGGQGGYSGFTPNPLTLGVSKLGTGSGTVTSSPAGINCGPTCSASYGHDTSVVLTASSSPGSMFAGWPGFCFGTDSCTVSMTGDKDVTAIFSLSAILNISKSGTGVGTVTSNPPGINCGPICRVEYPNDLSVMLTATPAFGSTFTGWFGGGCPNITSPTCVIPMTADRNVTATFTQ